MTTQLSLADIIEPIILIPENDIYETSLRLKNNARQELASKIADELERLLNLEGITESTMIVTKVEDGVLQLIKLLRGSSDEPERKEEWL